VLHDIGVDVALESDAVGFRFGGELKVTDSINAKRSSGTRFACPALFRLNAKGTVALRRLRGEEWTYPGAPIA